LVCLYVSNMLLAPKPFVGISKNCALYSNLSGSASFSSRHTFSEASVTLQPHF
jgi:hypothetical protein